MVELYGSPRSRRDLAAHAGSLTQFAGVRLMTLGDGVERGVRMLEFRSGTGLRFTVMVDRCFDIGDCDYRGMAIGWHSALTPSGLLRSSVAPTYGRDECGPRGAERQVERPFPCRPAVPSSRRPAAHYGG